jgi:hypothetical protein
MSLINELRAKSANAEATKSEVVAEIKRAFSSYLDSDDFENYLRRRAGKEEIQKRTLPINVQFWAFHSGCSTTNFNCGGYTWYNPENKEGYPSHSYKGVELFTIHNEICSYISNRLKSKMNELGFYLVSAEDVKGRLNYYHTLFYFGW